MGVVRREDISGRRFGKLVAESFAEIRNLKTYWNALCDCGRRVVVRIDQMKSGNSQSCGCAHRVSKEELAARAARRRKPADLSGRTFGRLTVTGPRECPPGRTKTAWPCRCECGSFVHIETHSLTSGRVQSCGCHRRDVAHDHGKRNRRHGMTDTPTWNAWHAMRLRCTNPNEPAYRHYGGRGITICERWDSFENFLADMGERPSPKHSLGRIDNDGNYCPENCRWETWPQQQRNRRTNVNLTFNGETHCIADWAEITGISRICLYTRIQNGWTVEDALTRPPRRGKPRPGMARKSRKRHAAT